MKPVKDLKVATGNYMKNGEEKTRWTKIGTMFKKDNGKFSIKLDAVPIHAEWDGWVNLFDPWSDDNKKSRDFQAPPADDLNDDIPF